MSMDRVSQLFGCQVFNQSVMRQRLPAETFAALQKTMQEHSPLSSDLAQVVATAMKEWAIENGATHYSHWFQPLTGMTAEKHDAFLMPADDGGIIMEFSGKSLTLGESDASSFPSGGLRATFEARGYTAWDPTSFAFVKDDTLYIPTAFCSFSGEALDQKTPLLRSMQAISSQALRVLKAIGNPASHVTTTVGPEQEYFLVDQLLYQQRQDLILTGRTLFGAKPPKGQEMEDHYFGNIKERVLAYMRELDETLWKLGVYAKTRHNEVAPAQHELAPVFTTTNIAADHNQLTMEVMKKIAAHHGLVCLLHEKPFAGVNGSGKHNNWSISTNTGENLLKPGSHPEQNWQFLLFLSAVIAAVDEYGDLLRLSAASAGNDHRLGANEAPPAIISMFIGEPLTDILEAIARGEDATGKERHTLKTGVTSMPTVRADTSDRNRTSPFAFTGNKFEFRMVGSSASISSANVMINTAVAEILGRFADRLENANDTPSLIRQLVVETYQKCGRIVFNGNNYSQEWVDEAAKRGLPNLRSTVEAIPVLLAEKNVALFTKHNIFSHAEIESRFEILLENYCKTINIEALTMLDMAKKQILPASLAYCTQVVDGYNAKVASGLPLNTAPDARLAERLASLCGALTETTDSLEKALTHVRGLADPQQAAKGYRQEVVTAMSALRAVADELEGNVPSDYWPFPCYREILFNI